MVEDGSVRDNVLALYEAGTGINKIVRLTNLPKRKVREILDPALRKSDAEELLLTEQVDAAQQQIDETALALTGLERVISVKLADGCELAWSGVRRKRNGSRHRDREYEWRLIVRDVDGEVEEVRNLSRVERIEVAAACRRLLRLLPS